MRSTEPTSTRPYLIRALYEWCGDNGFTPYVAVLVDDSVQVPREYVKNGEIVLNISCDATSGLKLGNEFIEFKARFAGVARDIMVPVNRVIAVYARENGQGMAFPVPVPASVAGPQPPSPLAAVVPMPSDGADDAAKVMQLVPSTGSDAAHDAGNGPADDGPPKPPGGSRPALKRIK